MEPVGAPPAQKRGLATRVVSLDEVRPEAFLRRFGDRPRGFWARGESWIGHAGAAKTLQVDKGSPYGPLWSEAQRVCGATTSEEDPSLAWARPPRFYGGIAFRQDHLPVDAWTGFPAGLFVLPELELEGGSGGYRLRASRLLNPWDDPGDVEEALQETLDRLVPLLGGDDSTSRRAARPATRTLPGQPAAGARDLWDGVVTDALNAIEAEQVSKVVLARTLDVTPDHRLDPVDVLLALWADNPRAHVFLFEPQPGATLLGAAPETVATVQGRHFHATAVAGSVSHGQTQEETAALAARLLASVKDLLEHRFAVEDMVERLEAIALEVGSEWEPHVITLSRIQHLETRIRAELPESCTVLDALEALHPTPAVCGLPRDAALDFIHDEEPFERGWYAGPVGWFDLAGSGVFAPALRCAVGQGSVWRLFAGAGIVAGSQPRSEWEETGIKFEPVLRALAASDPA